MRLPEEHEAGNHTILSLDDIPVAEAGVLRFSWSRGEFLRRAFGGAVAMSLTSMGFLSVKNANATHAGDDPYQIKQSCFTNIPGSCSPGCGPSPVCSTCCITNTGEHKCGWHRRVGAMYGVRHNQCKPGGGVWDGWLWGVGSSCGCCSGGLTYRCHDGFKCNSSGNNCNPTICRWKKSCSGPPGCAAPC